MNTANYFEIPRELEESLNDLLTAALNPKKNNSNYSKFGYELKVDDSGSYYTEIDVPGFNNKTLDIKYDFTKKEIKVSGKNGNRLADYSLVVGEIDPNTIQAKIVDGVLTLKFGQPKKKETPAEVKINLE